MILGKKSKNDAQRLWRPDFRDVQALPDTKVIRTGFLMNFVAIVLTLGIVTLYLFKEYSLQTVTQSVASLEEQVAGNTPENRSILDTNKRFRQSAAIMREVIAFDRQVLDFPRFVRELSSVLPEGILLDSIQIQPAPEDQAADKVAPVSVQLSGLIVSTSSVTPSQIISRFQEAIAALPSVEDRGLEMDLLQFQRNNEAGNFDFTLQVLVLAEEASEK